ncbi:MAG: 8-amino-7-oxononanoate synthase [Coriobacteriales bacterium]|nr:8-amino-7-oxononanoate synthase [Coriobacteriales bacterium]
MRESIEREMHRLEAEGVRRRLREQDDLGPMRAVIDGREALVFSANDYLGLSHHPDVVREAELAVARYGASASASRLVGGNHPLYRRLEASLARLKGTESAMVFATGYAANTGLLSSIAGTGDTMFVDKLDHASIYDGVALSDAERRRYPHVATDRLEAMLRADRDVDGRRFIVTDGVFSMDGDLAPIGELRRIADEHDCILIVDDAHGTGVVGPNGAGTSGHFGAHADIEVGTLSKALGSLGGFVACESAVAEYLVNKSRPFIFSTGLPPASVAAAARAVELLAEEPERQTRVLAISARVRAALSVVGFEVPEGFTPIVPIIVGASEDATGFSDACLAEGVFIPAIRTPSVPKGRARLRMTLSAAHTDEDVDFALGVLERMGKEMGLVG